MIVAIAVLLGCLAAAVATAAWPVTVSLAVLLGGIVVAAVRGRPAWAFAAAVLLFGLEGAIKLLLALEPTPLHSDPRAVGAAALDLVLFVTVIAVVVRTPLRDPRAWWEQLTRAERAVVLALAGWLVLSVAQIPQSGDVVRGLEGFRLSQAYVVVAVAAALVTARHRDRVPEVLLAIGGVVAGYAALRVALGPAHTEEQFATLNPTTVAYEGALRGFGSFSSAVGLGSFLTPLTVFALVTAYLTPRLRFAGSAVGALSLVAILGSYGRAPLAAIVLGLGAALVVLGVAADVERRRKLVAAMLIVGGLGVLYGGVVGASQASPQLRERAEGVLNPLGDESVRMRFEGWRDTFESSWHRPLGRGVGTVGAATKNERQQAVTTDNSYLKLFVEQGLPGVALFLFGVVGAAVLLGRRLVRAAPAARATGLAAWAGFVAFLGLSATGETIEQPGKVLTWACLGIAAAACLARNDAASDTAGTIDRRGLRALVRLDPSDLRRLAAVGVALLVLVPAGVSIARAPSYASTMELTPVAPRRATIGFATPRATLLGDQLLRDQVRPTQSQTATTFADVEIGQRRGRMILRVTAGTPERARRLVRVLARAVVAASLRGLVYAGPMKMATSPTSPPVERSVDRLIDALPGEMPGRPSPFWAALAGLLVAAAAWIGAQRLPLSWRGR
ncbi:MAG TPA: O-antigen ligase family protein [Solirubrobacteraceae bacterium]